MQSFFKRTVYQMEKLNWGGFTFVCFFEDHSQSSNCYIVLKGRCTEKTCNATIVVFISYSLYLILEAINFYNFDPSARVAGSFRTRTI